MNRWIGKWLVCLMLLLGGSAWATSDTTGVTRNTEALRLSLDALPVISTNMTSLLVSLGAVTAELTPIRLSLALSFDADKFLKTVPPFTTQTVSLFAAAAGTPLTLVSPYTSFGFQVAGVGGTLWDWDANLQGSLDGVTYTTLINHTMPNGQGATKWTVDKPVMYLKSTMVLLSMGGASTGARMFLIGK